MEPEDGTTVLVPRQIWIEPTTASTSLPPTCTPFVLSSGGLINVGRNTVLTLTQDAAFQPLCPGTPVPKPVDPTQPGVEAVLNYQDPFYSSTNPQIYAIAAVTVVSYMLVVILFITPRTFFVGGVGGGGGFLGQGGMVSGAYGSNSIIGVGSRPWLQKAATVAVAISLTIVTADTFKWAELQYDEGYDDATELTVKVIDGLEIRVVRVISETFLWLAQAQTLIRLFPRHKEKLVIKWTAFGLISLELLFSSLNQFVDQDGRSYPKQFASAIPALDYLFALALNLCYAAFVVYYSMVKRRFAFWNKKMRNMPLVALLSLTAVLIPVIFFILDLSQPNVSGWGNYVRWVGAAAASVIVWEWVERIEALERDEKKDGILGREIFDGDEMLENTPSSSTSFTRMRDRKSRRSGGTRDGGFGSSTSTGWHKLAARTKRLRRPHARRERLQNEMSEPETRSSQSTDQLELQRKPDTQSSLPKPPDAVASPVSRADTASAASTVYMVRYHPRTELSPQLPETPFEDPGDPTRPSEAPADTNRSSPDDGRAARNANTATTLNDGFSRILNPFRRQRNSPPLEVAQAMSSSSRGTTNAAESTNSRSLWQRLTWNRSFGEDEPGRPAIVIPPPQRRKPSVVNEDHNEDEHQGGQSPANDMEDGDPPLPSPSANRDSPPDAVLRVINSPHSSHQGSEHILDSQRPHIRCDTQLSRRGTLLISESRRPGEQPVSPLTAEMLTMDNHRAQEEWTPETRQNELTKHGE